MGSLRGGMIFVYIRWEAPRGLAEFFICLHKRYNKTRVQLYIARAARTEGKFWSG